MKFEKVSFEEFKRACLNCTLDVESDESLRQMYDNIKLPTRATKGSAGYDFYIPTDTLIPEGHWRTFPTGIRCQIDEGYFLMCCPKSGLGFKSRTRLANTIGVIDFDYYYSDNEGHIMAKMSAERATKLHAGDKFMQGILIPFAVTDDDQAEGIRNGGFGSTGA